MLGDLEAEIMERVWACPAEQSVTVRSVWEALYPTRPVMYTTVMNTMTRLARKGLLLAEKSSGSAFLYRPTVSRAELVDRFVGGALERLLTNFGGATRARLHQIAADPVWQERLSQLMEPLDARRATEEPEG